MVMIAPRAGVYRAAKARTAYYWWSRPSRFVLFLLLPIYLYCGSMGDWPLPGFEANKESSYLHQEPVDSKTLYEKQQTVERLALAATLTGIGAGVMLAATAALLTTDLVLNATAE